MLMAGCKASDSPGPGWTVEELRPTWVEMWDGMTPSERDRQCAATDDGRLEEALLAQPDPNREHVDAFIDYLYGQCAEDGRL